MSLTPTEKVWIRLSEQVGIDSYSDIDPTHAAIGCAGCHQGNSPADAKDDTSAYRMAHKNMIADPSAEAEYGCNGSQCHSDIVRQNATSMHSQLWGEKAHIALRAGYASWEECPSDIKDGWEKDCSSCHTTCGQCHVSIPHSAGKGFLVQRVGYSHKFIRTPDEANVCTACHGSRVGDDWNANETRLPGNVPDAHNQAGMTCLDCHHEDLHGDGPSDAEYTSRYEVDGLPQCVDCHGASSSSNIFHAKHWPNGDFTDGADLACYTCHSQQYTSCNTCHAGRWKSEYETDNTGHYQVYPSFKLGRNPNYGDDSKPHAEVAWTTVRHIPISEDAYDEWGYPSLANFNAMETWKYASPHSIQRWTARTLIDSSWTSGAGYTESNCYQNCHYHEPSNGSFGTIINADLFLRQADFTKNYGGGHTLTNELDANENVMIDHPNSFCMDNCHPSHY